MASIQKRDNGKWRARYRDDAGKEHARHFPRKVDAQKWLDKVTTAIGTGTYVDPKAGALTFAEWFAVYLDDRFDWADGTVTAAQRAADGVTFSGVPMNKISTAHIEAWLRTLKKPGDGQKRLAASTVHMRYNYVRMAFSEAVRKRIIGADPFDGIAKRDRPKGSKQQVTSAAIPTPEKVGEAIEAAPEFFRAFLGVCAFAGLRLGEAAALQVGDVDFLRRTITVRQQVQGTNVQTVKITPPKGRTVDDDARVIHVAEQLITMLSQHVADVGTHGDEQWLFSDVWGNLFNRSSAGHQWRRTRAVVGLEDFTLHDLRHFYASGLIRAGCDVVTVQRALGHSSPSITLDTYSHLWLDASDRTRSAGEGLMLEALGPPADSLRTPTAE